MHLFLIPLPLNLFVKYQGGLESLTLGSSQFKKTNTTGKVTENHSTIFPKMLFLHIKAAESHDRICAEVMFHSLKKKENNVMHSTYNLFIIEDYYKG